MREGRKIFTKAPSHARRYQIVGQIRTHFGLKIDPTELSTSASGIRKTCPTCRNSHPRKAFCMESPEGSAKLALPRASQRAWLPWHKLTAVNGAEPTIRWRRYGILQCQDGSVKSIQFRPYPAITCWWHARWLGEWSRRKVPEGELWIYFDQPLGWDPYLAIKYAVAGKRTTPSTLQAAMTGLELIAKIKGCQALLCDAASPRLKPELLARWGWVPHAPSAWHRNFIKRLYDPPSGTWTVTGQLSPNAASQAAT